MGELAVTQERETEAGSEAAKQSGRYTIDTKPAAGAQPMAATQEPPPLAAKPNSANSAILAVHRLSEEELTWIEERTNKVPAKLLATVRPLPIIAPATPANTNAPAGEEELPALGALRPYYREPTLERVQLQFEDKSLDPWQNPLALSSLQPPPPRGFAKLSQLPGLQNVLIGVGALALVGVGYLAAVASTGASNAANDRGSVTTFAPARESGAARVEVAAPEDVSALRVVANKAPARAEAPAQPQAKEAMDDSLETEPLWSSATPIEPAPPAPATEQEKAAAASSAALQPRGVRPLRAKLPTLAPASTGLPMQPSRDEIKTAVESLRATLQACAGSAHGLTTARITILGTGRVAIANIEGAFAGTPEGSCMARALRSAAFPRFSAPTLQVTYPFRL